MCLKPETGPSYNARSPFTDSLSLSNMRFRFCGDLDAPDWLLSEVATLSKISSVRMKIVVKQVLAHLVKGQIDFQQVLKMTKDALPENADVQGAIAGLNFILLHAAKYDVDENTLLAEVQQLGMPKENSEAIVRPFREAKDELRRQFSLEVLQLAKLRSCAWRVDQLVCSSRDGVIGQPVVQLKLAVDEEPHVKTEEGGSGGAASKLRRVGIRLSSDKFQVLYRDLVDASQYLASLRQA